MSETSLTALLDHLESVDADSSLERVIRRFQEHGQHYMAVLEGDTYLGLLSDAQVGTMLGSRFGFSLHIRDAARHHMLPDVLCAEPECSLLLLLERTMGRQGALFYFDVPLVAKDGRFLGIMSIQRLIREQARIMANHIELAERRRCELEISNQQFCRSLEDLRQSEGRYVSLFQHSPLGIALLTREGRVEICNQRLRSWLNPLKGDGDWSVTDYLSPSDLEPFLTLVPDSSGKSETSVVEGEFTLHLAERGPRRFRVHASWIEETDQICAALQDITNQRALERGMALQEKAALFERLAGGLAHELNNKLTPVVGYAELLSLRLESLPDAHKALAQCQTIRNSAAESVRMVRQLLQLGRPPQSEKLYCDLNDVVKEAWTIVEYKLKAVSVACSLDLSPGKAPVHVDGSQIKQVVVNLVINAIDALENAPQKRLHLSVSLQGSSASLIVKDSGHGIPHGNLQRIFDPFFTTKSPDRGTGLGLSVCLSILQQHNGDIQVTSTTGEGSIFTITLPLIEAKESSKPPDRWQFPDPIIQDRTVRVLVIDDETHITELIRETLQAHCGWRVETCNDMGKALETLGRQVFNLVLTDLRMPGLDGFALLSWAKAHYPSLLARVLVITADPGEMDLESAWGVRLLRKPFRTADLVETCRSLLPGHIRFHPPVGPVTEENLVRTGGEDGFQESACSGEVTKR